jgi:hypothetical protein
MTAGKAVLDSKQKQQAFFDAAFSATEKQRPTALSESGKIDGAAASAANAADRNVLTVQDASTSESNHLNRAVQVATAASQRLRALADATDAAQSLLRNRVDSADASTATAVHNQQGQNSDVGATLAFTAIGQSISRSVELAADHAATPAAVAASSTNVQEGPSRDKSEPVELYPDANSNTDGIQALLPAGPPPARQTSTSVLLAAMKLQRAARKIQQRRLAAGGAKSSPGIISLGGSESTKRCVTRSHNPF